MLTTYLTKVFKYFIEGLAVAIATSLVRGNLNIEETLSIAIVATLSMMVLDNIVPEIGENARVGSGFGIGYGLVGGSDESSRYLDNGNLKLTVPTQDGLALGREYNTMIKNDYPNFPHLQNGGKDEVLTSDGDSVSTDDTSETLSVQEAEQSPEHKPQREETVVEVEKPQCGNRKPYRVPYHVVDNQYSDKALLAGYNEDVLPANTPNILDYQHQTILDNQATIPHSPVC